MPSEQARQRVLAIEIEHNGHHPGYVRNFALTWAKHKIAADLKFLVTKQFFQRHQEEVSSITALQEHGISIEEIPCSFPDRAGARYSIDYWTAWNVFCESAAAWQADCGLLMYSDFFQLPVWLGRTSPCPLNAIYFRPTYHYSELPNYNPNWKDRFKAFRKKWLIKKFLNNPKMKRVFCLDPLAVDYINRNFRKSCEVEFLPDTLTRFDESPHLVQRVKNGLQVETGRRIFLLMGVLDRRKGVTQLLQSCLALPLDSARKICLVLVGRITDDYRDEVMTQIKRLEEKGEIQIVLRDEFIPEADVQLFYMAADLILGTYQKHLGSSAALIRAALARKPVLVSNFGLMGEITEKHKLGKTVDTQNLKAMSASLTDAAHEDLATWMDLPSAQHFASENTSDALAACLQKIIGSEPKG